MTAVASASLWKRATNWFSNTARQQAAQTANKTTATAEKLLTNNSKHALNTIRKEGVAETAKKAGRNRFVPDANAIGSHTVFRRDPIAGKISKYETYKPQSNPLNPNRWESIKRYDGHQINEVHFNKFLQKQIRTPHVHDPLTPGGIRSAELWEIPK